jgi:DNA repair protein RecN (Recombination protein N)
MLSELFIRNFAIIEDLTIRLEDGLTVLSGETGAGKSIIINAVNLLLGSRATASMIRTGEETAELSALFYLPEKSPARDVLVSNGYPEGDELLIRRIISTTNRHKVYINDRPATMQLLSAVTDNLAAISGQHEHQRLLKEPQHLFFLDQFAGLLPLRKKVRDCFRELSPLLRERDELSRSLQRQSEQLELLRFQQQEILDAAISSGEDIHLKEELSRIKNAELLYKSVGTGIELLYSAEGAAFERISEVRKTLEKISAIDPDLSPAAQALADINVRIEDATEALRAHLGTISFDEQRIDAIEARLDQLNRLKRKYGGDLDAVSAHLERVGKEIEGFENLETAISENRAAVERKEEELIKLCRKLSRERKTAAEALGRRMEEELASLEMKDTRFRVELSAADEERSQASCHPVGDMIVTETGLEGARFLIAPNIGEALRPLSAIASGGELSRVILALKAIMADSDVSATLIFDEVDAGIGGAAAERVGEKLLDLSRIHQVICITHLAQIAKFGLHHYKISKVTEGERTRTRIVRLESAERVEETARMISGTDITRTTREHAKEMLAHRGRTEDRS